MCAGHLCTFRFIYFLLPHPPASIWPYYITTPDNLIPHAPELMKLLLPDIPASLLTLHGFTSSSNSGALADIICLSINVEKSNMPTKHTKDWKSALGCRQSLRCWLLYMKLRTLIRQLLSPALGNGGKGTLSQDAVNPSLIPLLSPVTSSLVWCIQVSVPLPVPFCYSCKVDSHSCTKKKQDCNSHIFHDNSKL